MRNRLPVRTQRGHLSFTRSGTVWANWILSATPYGFSPDKKKQDVRNLHQGLLRALPGESLLQGVCATTDPAAVVERMLQDVDLDKNPAWVEECSATMDTLSQIVMSHRVYVLSVPLSDGKGVSRSQASLRAAGAALREAMALPSAAISESELARRMEQARQIEATIPAMFNPTPMTPAQMAWLQVHAQQRGLGIDDPMPSGLGEDIDAARSGSRVDEPLIDERGLSDLDKSALKKINPLTRRFVKIMSPGDIGSEPITSYQCVLAMSDAPAQGICFPGTEIVGRIDDSGIEADWALRLLVRSRDEAAAANQKALNNLNDQYSQRGGDSQLGNSSWEIAYQDLGEYVGVLASDELEVEVQATLIIATGAPDAQTATDQARALTGFFTSAGFKMSSPAGHLSDLWWAMVPGIPTSSVVRDYAQTTSSRAASALVPLAGTALGDRKGSLMGLNITSGLRDTVLHDLNGHVESNMSGSMAFGGDPGGGKSVAMKTQTGNCIDRGGRAVIVDPTDVGEWASWAGSVTDATVVGGEDSPFSLDPLRVFGAGVGGRLARAFLTPLLDVKPMSEMGVLLRRVLAADYLREHGLTGLAQVHEHLASLADPSGLELSHRLGYFIEDSYARVIFDQSLPPVPLETPALVIRTNHVQLPSKAQLESKHLFDQLPPEKIFGRAFYDFIAAMARHICFSDSNRLALLVVDEAYRFTHSPEASRELEVFVRDGRKHKAALLIASQDPLADFGSDTMRRMIPVRALFRTVDADAARSGAKWIGLDSEDQDVIELVTTELSPKDPATEEVPEHRRGEALFRDAYGTIGKTKMLMPSNPKRARAAMASPGRNSDAAARAAQARDELVSV